MSSRSVHITLRGTSAALAALAAVQVLLAGSFLSGHYPVLRWHMLAGFSMVVLALVQAVLSFLPGRRDRPSHVLGEALAVPVVLALQGVLGVFRVLELHVPIGVLMAVGLFRLAAWWWRTPLPPRPTPAPRPESAPADERPGIERAAAGRAAGDEGPGIERAAAGRVAGDEGRGLAGGAIANGAPA
jgi:hypothetical protein